MSFVTGIRGFLGSFGVNMVLLLGGAGGASAQGKPKPVSKERAAVSASFAGVKDAQTAAILRQMGCRSEAQLQRDIVMMAENLFMEARGGGLQGMADVAQVLRNRANSHIAGRGVCLADQVEAKFQFEWLNKHMKDGRLDPAYVPGSEAAEVMKRIPAEAKAWADALALAKISVAADHAYEHRLVNFEGATQAHLDALKNAVDAVDKADHYYATWMNDQGVAPVWREKMQQVMERGGHRFLDSGRCKEAAAVPQMELPAVEEPRESGVRYAEKAREQLNGLLDALAIMQAGPDNGR